MMGFEPTTNGTTNHYSNRLSYTHREFECKDKTFFSKEKQFCLFFYQVHQTLNKNIAVV
jgi:hypothetical protein